MRMRAPAPARSRRPCRVPHWRALPSGWHHAQVCVASPKATHPIYLSSSCLYFTVLGCLVARTPASIGLKRCYRLSGEMVDFPRHSNLPQVVLVRFALLSCFSRATCAKAPTPLQVGESKRWLLWTLCLVLFVLRASYQ